MADQEEKALAANTANSEDLARALAALKEADAAWKKAAYIAWKAQRAAAATHRAAMDAANAYGEAQDKFHKLVATNPANSEKLPDWCVSWIDTDGKAQIDDFPADEDGARDRFDELKAEGYLVALLRGRRHKETREPRDTVTWEPVDQYTGD